MTGSAVINPACLHRPDSADIALLARQAMIDEVLLTPKPGLVDAHNNGSHRDMDLWLFMRSIDAITPWFSRFWAQGFQSSHLAESALLRLIRPVGMACEQSMFNATHGVNTHKGGIFSLGLLCTAAGWLSGRQQAVTLSSLCETVRLMTKGLVARELQGRQQATTAGERLFLLHGLTGARGEAESGFQLIRQHILPWWFTERCPQRRLHHALLRLMAVNPDTNLVSRGGMEGLRFVQFYAGQLLENGWRSADLAQMDEALIARNLSPGGSADLLAVTQVLMHYAV
ncbi:triphosphoribosyl-dephospho-CoA synthase CitG [Klebsiella michiganensis]